MQEQSGTCQAIKKGDFRMAQTFRSLLLGTRHTRCREKGGSGCVGASRRLVLEDRSGGTELWSRHNKGGGNTLKLFLSHEAFEFSHVFFQFHHPLFQVDMFFPPHDHLVKSVYVFIGFFNPLVGSIDPFIVFFDPAS